MSILEKLGEGATKVFDTVAGFVAPVLAVGKGVLDLKTASKQRQAVEAQVEAAELERAVIVQNNETAKAIRGEVEVGDKLTQQAETFERFARGDAPAPTQEPTVIVQQPTGLMNNPMMLAVLAVGAFFLLKKGNI